MAPVTRHSTGGTKWTDQDDDYSDEDDYSNEDYDDEYSDMDEPPAKTPSSAGPTPSSGGRRSSMFSKIKSSSGMASKTMGRFSSKLTGSSRRSSISSVPEVEERRLDTDGAAYTKEEFEDEYGEGWEEFWDEAPPATVPKAVATPILRGSTPRGSTPRGSSGRVSKSPMMSSYHSDEDGELPVKRHKMPYMTKLGFGISSLGWRTTQVAAYLGAGFAAATGIFVGALAFGISTASGSLNGKDRMGSPQHLVKRRPSVPPPSASMGRGRSTRSYDDDDDDDDFIEDSRAGARVLDAAAAFHERGKARHNRNERKPDWLSRRDDD